MISIVFAAIWCSDNE